VKWLAITVLAAACSNPRTTPPLPEVNVWGALREMIHDGRVEARVELASVLGANSYGLGALAGMRGEVTILDGAAWISVGERDSGRATRGVTSDSAALLVMATVPSWRSITIETDISAADLDARIEQYIAAAGISTDRPVPFVVDGSVEATWHVLKGPPAPGSNPHDHARNAVVGTHAGSANVVGFFSKKHQGIFTHMGHTVHAHVIDTGSSLAAHADELSIRAGAVLRLPQ
jgi:alpha-acetolactate decarboxylase